MRSKISPTGQVINPLLDVWERRPQHPSECALPVEELLTALVSRSATTPGELMETLDEVRIATLQASVLDSA
jgi:hypothetical protein